MIKVSILAIFVVFSVAACSDNPAGAPVEMEEPGPQLPPSQGNIVYAVSLPADKLPWPHHQPDLDQTGYEQLIRDLWVINNFGQYQQGSAKEETYFHDGLDVVIPNGTRLFSLADGVVRSTLYGAVTIEDMDQPGYGWSYTHVGGLRVGVGSLVSKGGYVADVDFQGLEHLHLSRIRLADGGDWDDIYDWQFLHVDSLFVYNDTQPPVIEDTFYYFKNNTDSLFAAGTPATVVSGEVDIVIGARDPGEFAHSKSSGFGDRLALAHIEYEISGDQIEPRTFKSIDFRPFPLQRRRPNILFDYDRVANVYKSYLTLHPEGPQSYDKIISYYVITNTAGVLDEQGLNLPDKDYAWNTAATDEMGQPLFPNGLYTITVTAYDAAGNSTTISDQARVENWRSLQE